MCLLLVLLGIFLSIEFKFELKTVDLDISSVVCLSTTINRYSQIVLNY